MNLAENQFVQALSGFEEAYEKPEDFRGLCGRLRRKHPETKNWSFVQWYLQPTEVSIFPRMVLCDEFRAAPSSDWAWEGSLEGCTSAPKDGLRVQAENGKGAFPEYDTHPCLKSCRFVIR